MPGFHMIATIVAVATIARRTINIVCMFAKIKAFWEILIVAIATIAEIEMFLSQRLRRSQSLRSLQYQTKAFPYDRCDR